MQQNHRPRLRAPWVHLAAAMVMICAALSPAILRAEITVNAEVSQQVLTLGGTVVYTITVTGTDERINANELRIPENLTFEGFEVAPGSPSTYTQQSWINGRVSETRTFTWRLTAIREGMAKIPAMRFAYGSRTFSTPELEVKVMREEAEDAEGQGGEAGMAGILPAQTEHENLNSQLKGRLFARLTFSDPNPYVQEAVLASCKIYIDPQIAGQIGNVDWNPPAWVDFFSQRLKQGQLQLKQEEFGGKRYSVVNVAQFLLAPTRAGKIAIPLNMAEATIRIRTSPQFEDRFFNDRFFGSSMFDRSVIAKLPIAPITVEARPLPTEGRPASFQNAVGKLNFAAGVDRQSITQDDLLTLRIEVGGEGYIGGVSQPQLPAMPEWSRAGAQAKIEGADELRSFRGKKVFEILLRPEKTGTLTIPPIAYAFFDPTQGRYIEQMSEPFAIQVAKGSEQRLLVSASAPTTTSAERSAQFFGEQLAYIHTGYPESAHDEPLYRNPLFLLLQALPLLMVGSALAVRARRRYVTTHLDALQYRSAGTRARRELRAAQTALQAADPQAFHTKLGEALRTYLATKLRRAAAGLTLEEIESACLTRGVDSVHAAAIRHLLEQCDQARYLGTAAGNPDAMRATLEESERVLAHMDKHL